VKGWKSNARETFLPIEHQRSDFVIGHGFAIWVFHGEGNVKVCGYGVRGDIKDC